MNLDKLHERAAMEQRLRDEQAKRGPERMTIEEFVASQQKAQPRQKKRRNMEEHNEQVRLFELAALHSRRCPELRLLFAIPNGDERSTRTVMRKGKQVTYSPGGQWLLAEGLKPGVPDTLLPVARSGYHGLFIEMKRKRRSYTSEEQRDWHADLREQGYRVEVCRGCDEAWGVLCEYLGINNRKGI